MKNQPEKYFPTKLHASCPMVSIWHWVHIKNRKVSIFLAQVRCESLCFPIFVWLIWIIDQRVNPGSPKCQYIAVHGTNMLNYCMWNGILSNYRQLLPAMVIYLAELRTWRLRANIYHRHSHSVRRTPVLPTLSPYVESLPFFFLQRLTSAKIARWGFFSQDFAEAARMN